MLPRMQERTPCVHIPASGFNGTWYGGATSTLIRRIVRHRDGAVDGFTSRPAVKHLVRFETSDTIETAVAGGKWRKKWPRDWKRTVIERTDPDWRDLCVTPGIAPLRRIVRSPRGKPGVTIWIPAYRGRIIVRSPQLRPPHRSRRPARRRLSPVPRPRTSVRGRP